MSVLVNKPVVAASLVATALVYLGYLWFAHREQERGEDGEASQLTVPPQLQLDQVQEKLNCLKRSRLETLEEEPNQSDLAAASASEAQAETKDETVVEAVSEERTNCSEAVFASTDIRYKPTADSEEVEVVTEASEKVATEECDKVATEVVCDIKDIEAEIVTVETTVEEVVELGQVLESQPEISSMAVDESPHIINTTKIPDVMSALKDPICSPLTPPSPHSYSSSPVKSESSESKSSSCEWSDLIEQDERELQEFPFDSKVLSSKLSGLELATAGGRSGDSGVVSPSEEEREEKQDKHAEKQKSRTQSGEDAGIGLEQGDAISSEVNYEDSQLLAFHFHIPDYLCGKLIGNNGTFIKKLKEDCRVNIILKETREKLKIKRPRSRKDQK